MSIKDEPKLREEDVKIGTKAEKLWTDVAKEAKILIEQGEKNLIVQNAIFKLAIKKIKEEKEKFK